MYIMPMSIFMCYMNIYVLFYTIYFRVHMSINKFKWITCFVEYIAQMLKQNIFLRPMRNDNLGHDFNNFFYSSLLLFERV